MTGVEFMQMRGGGGGDQAHADPVDEPGQFVPVRDDLARITVTGADLQWRMSLAAPAGRAPSAAARALVAMIEEAA
jgi:hypothetical protein